MNTEPVEQATLTSEAERAILWRTVANRLREMPDVRQVLVSDARREIIVIGNDYSHVALKDVA